MGGVRGCAKFWALAALLACLVARAGAGTQRKNKESKPSCAFVIAPADHSDAYTSNEHIGDVDSLAVVPLEPPETRFSLLPMPWAMERRLFNASFQIPPTVLLLVTGAAAGVEVHAHGSGSGGAVASEVWPSGAFIAEHLAFRIPPASISPILVNCSALKCAKQCRRLNEGRRLGLSGELPPVSLSTAHSFDHPEEPRHTHDVSGGNSGEEAAQAFGRWLDRVLTTRVVVHNDHVEPVKIVLNVGQQQAPRVVKDGERERTVQALVPLETSNLACSRHPRKCVLEPQTSSVVHAPLGSTLLAQTLNKPDEVFSHTVVELGAQPWHVRSAEVTRYLGEALMGYFEARAPAEYGADEPPPSALDLLLAAQAGMFSGNLTGVKGLLLEKLRRPDDAAMTPFASYWAGWFLLRLKQDPMEGLEALKGALDIWPGHPGVQYVQAMLLQATGLEQGLRLSTTILEALCTQTYRLGESRAGAGFLGYESVMVHEALVENYYLLRNFPAAQSLAKAMQRVAPSNALTTALRHLSAVAVGAGGPEVDVYNPPPLPVRDPEAPDAQKAEAAVAPFAASIALGLRSAAAPAKRQRGYSRPPEVSPQDGGWDARVDETLLRGYPLGGCDIDVLSGTDLHRDTIARYANLSKPALFTKVLGEWLTAGGRWTKESLTTEPRYAEATVEVQDSTAVVFHNTHSQAHPSVVKWQAKLPDAVRQVAGAAGGVGTAATKGSAPPMPVLKPYLFMRNMTEPIVGDFSHLEAFRDVFSWDEGMRNTNGFFFVGGSGSGTYCHAHSHAWNALAYGSKLWFLLPPFVRFGPHSMDMRAWYANVFPSLPVEPLRCVQHAGEVLYVPAGWIHCVVNVNDVVGVAVETGPLRVKK